MLEASLTADAGTQPARSCCKHPEFAPLAPSGVVPNENVELRIRRRPRVAKIYDIRARRDHADAIANHIPPPAAFPGSGSTRARVRGAPGAALPPHYGLPGDRRSTGRSPS